MDKAKKTVNVFINSVIETHAPDFNQTLFNATGISLYTGDEEGDLKVVTPPSVSIEWLSELPGLKPESTGYMFQLTLKVPDSNSDLADKARDAILDGLELRTGSYPLKVIPKKDFSGGMPGVEVGTQVILYLYRNRKWDHVPSDEAHERAYVLTLIADYVPG